MNDGVSPIVFVALFPILFGGIWCAVTLLLSVIGGWRRLADRYPARRPASGTRFRMQRGKVGAARYENCLTIHASPEGLHLAVWLAFRLGHPPLFIPWSAIHPRAARRFLREEMVECEVGAPRLATLWLPKRVFDAQGVAVAPTA